LRQGGKARTQLSRHSEAQSAEESKRNSATTIQTPSSREPRPNPNPVKPKFPNKSHNKHKINNIANKKLGVLFCTILYNRDKRKIYPVSRGRKIATVIKSIIYK
jgi:hypothetical protein